jgi:hypothetical protein
MPRNLHLLMALPSDSGPIVFAPKLAEHLPVQGLRVYFPSGHPVRADKVSYWMRRLNSDPLDWIAPSEKKWRIDLDAAKTLLYLRVGPISISRHRAIVAVLAFWIIVDRARV